MDIFIKKVRLLVIYRSRTVKLLFHKYMKTHKIND